MFSSDIELTEFTEKRQEEGEEILPEFFDSDHPRDLRSIFVAQGVDDNRVLAFPSIGTIKHHMLISPEEGSYSAANLPSDMRNCLFTAAKEIRSLYKDRQDSYDGAPLLVEHGAASSLTAPTPGAQIGCACVNHPHLHLIPFKSGVKFQFMQMCWLIGGNHDLVISDPEELEQLKGKPYLLLQPWVGSRDTMFVWLDPKEKFGRQFIRRAVFHVQQCGDNFDEALARIQSDPGQEWNWRENPGYDVVRETNRVLRRLLTR